MSTVKDQELLKHSRKVLASHWNQIVNNTSDLQLQLQTGLDRSSIGSYRRGDFLPSLPVCAKLRKATGFDFNNLLDLINTEGEK